jgi:arabinogalactan endo-1,4-beta-galactosidase
MQPLPRARTIQSAHWLADRAVASFIISAGLILLVTGLAKIISMFGVARVLGADVPILPVTYGHLLLAVGVAELLIATLCFLPKTRRAALRCVAIISTLFLIYRIGLWAAGWHGFCGCMGNLTGEIGISTETAGRVMMALLTYLLCGSYTALAYRFLRSRKARLSQPPAGFATATATFLAALVLVPHARALDFASGADVSWLPQMEAAGVKYEDANGVQGDLLTIMHGMGFNAVRLRTWVNPSNDACNGHCSQAETIALAVRAKNAGLRVMIDFHYGDTWNSEGTQNPPAAWVGLSYAATQTALYNYTYNFCIALQQAGVTPEWISTGNEENSGICHPVGSISNPAQMTGLIMQGYNAIKAVFPNCNVVIHVAGPQNASATAMLDAYQANGGKWDITGFSSYASGGDVPGVQANAASWVARYGKPIMQVEVGGPVTDPTGTQSTCQTCINSLKSLGTDGRGIFYWEPETNICNYTSNAWNSTTMEATAALTPFATAATALTPLVPTNLNAASGAPQVALTWTAGASATSYNIYRSTVTGGPYTFIGASSTTGYVDSGVVNGTTYFYVVSGSNSIGVSGTSSEAQATPLPHAIFVTWKGDGVSNVWSAGGNTNWTDGTSPTSYVTGYNVTFDDSGSVSPTITLSGTLLPGSVTVSSTKDYVFGGTGSLAGTMPLNKTGIGTLTLTNPGTYTGVTDLVAGTLQLANSLALQDSSLASNGGSLTFTGITSVTLAGLTGAGSLSLTSTSNAPVALTVGAGNVANAYSGGLIGSGSLTKSGTATLTLTGSNSYTGSTNVNAGTLEISPGGVINGGTLNGTGFLVDGGTCTSIGTTTFGNLANAFLQTSGASSLGTVSEGSSDGMLIKITGGYFSASSITLRRTAAFTTAPTATAPIAAATTSGLYINGGGASVILGTLTVGNLNSSASARLDAGTVTATGKVLVGQTTNSRWSILQVNGGSFTSTDSVNGIVVSQNNGTNPNNAELYLSGGTLTAETVAFGASTDTAAGSSFLIVSNASMYIGSGGIVRPNTAGLTSVISLISGMIGAKADWSSVLPVQLSGTGFTFNAADISGNAHNITLSGVLSGAGALSKTGGGTLTLSASNTYSGSTSISAGSLLVNGFLASPTVTVQSNATLAGSGTLAGAVTINSGGTLTAGASSFTINGNVVNRGLVRFTGGAAPQIKGTFTNFGVLDIMTGAQSLPGNFINSGVVLDSSVVKASAIVTNGAGVNVTIQSYTGHGYQLQRSASISNPSWQNIGASLPGATGTSLTLTDPSGMTGSGGFYRVLVAP